MIITNPDRIADEMLTLLKIIEKNYRGVISSLVLDRIRTVVALAEEAKKKRQVSDD